ncbi:TRAP transporter permease [Acuticoccus kandeliae]|uniref:TRAP transporter permease n=1 Tax=Acuticoccus kandeliae TaxID=2073160 RepID=UPI00130037F5|nr:TRAP transporter fused permease subunit [Acuticoccus kandeliae]
MSVSQQTVDGREKLDGIERAARALGLAACAGLTLFLFYTIALGRYTNWVQYEVALALVLVAVFMLRPGPLAGLTVKGDLLLSLILSGLAVYGAWYMINNHAEIAAYRTGIPNGADLFVFATGTLIVLEAARRSEGWILLSIILLAIGYLLAGPFLPGILSHRGMDIWRIAELSYSQQGIFGVAFGSVVNVVLIFVIFGTALRIVGAADFFEWVSSIVTMGRRSGAAQCSIIASALFGSINGSSSANVVANGPITINLMQKAGYSRAYAGAMEASSSVVGQIMPPVMGVGAFIMAEITGISYPSIMLAGLVPSLLFLFSLSVGASLEAGRLQLAPLRREREPWSARRISQCVTVVTGFTVLLYLLLTGYSVDLAGLAATGTVIAIAMVLPAIRPTWKELVSVVVEGGRDGIGVAASCAAIGIIIAAVTSTGLGVKLSQSILFVGDNNLLLALLLAGACSLVLGMGLPTAASYLMVVFIAGPSLIELGLPKLGVHLFLFYFAVMSAITPPVALAVFAAAAIAQAPVTQIAFVCLRLCIVAFILPFLWVYQPVLMLQDLSLASLPYLVLSLASLVFAVVLLAAGQVGYFRGRLSPLERLGAAVAALLIFVPHLAATVGGAALGLLLIARWVRGRREVEGLAA